jgi:hypothetical protein
MTAICALSAHINNGKVTPHARIAVTLLERAAMLVLGRVAVWATRASARSRQGRDGRAAEAASAARAATAAPTPSARRLPLNVARAALARCA